MPNPKVTIYTSMSNALYEGHIHDWANHLINNSPIIDKETRQGIALNFPFDGKYNTPISASPLSIHTKEFKNMDGLHAEMWQGSELIGTYTVSVNFESNIVVSTWWIKPTVFYTPNEDEDAVIRKL